MLQLPPANAQAPAAQAGVPRSQTPLSRHCVAPGLTEAYMTQQVMPQHANSIAITFGGQVCVCVYIGGSWHLWGAFVCLHTMLHPGNSVMLASHTSAAQGCIPLAPHQHEPRNEQSNGLS